MLLHADRKDRSDWADAEADKSLRLAHRSFGFVMLQLKSSLSLSVFNIFIKIELPHNTTNKITCASSEDSDQPGHPPSLISLHCALKSSQGPKLSSCGQRRL